MEAKDVRSLQEAYASIYEGYKEKEKEEKEEKEEKDCVDKEEKGKHNCAKKVCHEQFGEGTCIFGEHAVPDENGFVSHYDVLFNHGVEKDVPVSEMEVLEEGSHNEDYHRYEGEMVDEGMGLVTGTAKAVNAVLKPKGQTPEEEKKAVGNLTKAMDVVAKPVKGAVKAVLGVGPEKNAAMMNKRRPTAAQSAKMEEVDIFDIVKGYLIGEGATEDEVYEMMAHLTDDQRDAIVEAEVLAMKNGVPGSVKVKPALSIPGTSIGVGPNRPVKGTFTTTTPEQRAKIKSGDTHIDRGVGGMQPRQGAGPTQNERRRYNAELAKQNKYNAPRMPL